MPDYRVEWAVDVSAPTPEDAAREAQRMQRSFGTWASVYEVRDADGEAETVDLAEIEQEHRRSQEPFTAELRDWRYGDMSAALTVEEMSGFPVAITPNASSLSISVKTPKGERIVYLEVDRGVLRVRGYGDPDEPIGEMRLYQTKAVYGTEFDDADLGSAIAAVE